MKRIDAAFRVSPLVINRDGIGEGAFEGNEIGPANRQLTRSASATHAACHIDCLGTADQHLFRIAAAQGTGSAER